MSKIFIISILLLSLASSVLANDIVSKTTYSDGTVVLKCKNGINIDFCNVQDEKNYIKCLNNPKVSVVEQLILNQQESNNFNQKCYNTQQKIYAGANVINSVADTARMITSFMRVSW